MSLTLTNCMMVDGRHFERVDFADSKHQLHDQTIVDNFKTSSQLLMGVIDSSLSEAVS